MLVMWSSKGEKIIWKNERYWKLKPQEKEFVHMTIEAASGNTEIQKC